jgi:hypothetical protein
MNPSKPRKSNPTDSAIAELLIRCKDDPGLFNVAVLGRSPYWWRQEEICRSAVRHKTTVVETGNIVGKSFLAAGLIAWWLWTRPYSLVVVTAPSQTLLGTVVFKELRKAIKEARFPLWNECRITDSPQVSPQLMTIRDGWGAIGIATTGVERLSGQHNPQLLQIVDETSGVKTEIHEALQSQGAERKVFFGNPLRSEGEFVNLAVQAEQEAGNASIPDDERTYLINIPSTDSPDIHLRKSKRGLADASFINDSKNRYGENSLWYRTHIKAIRPTTSHDILLVAEWLDRCVGRARSNNHAWGVTRLGCDLGEGVGRDKSTFLVRDDLGIKEIVAGNDIGLYEAAGVIAKLIHKWRIEVENVTYDALGIGRDLPLQLERHGITGATGYKGSYSGGPNFTNLRGLSAWSLRNFFDPMRTGHIPFSIPDGEHWPAMRKELLALRYDLAGQKTRLESKEDLMKRLGHSPDYADSFIQTFSMVA